MLPLVSSFPSVVIILPVFDIVQLHVSSQNDISMSLLLILVMYISESSDVSLTLLIQLDVINVEEVADPCSISELVSMATLCDDLPEGVQANAEQQWGLSISLVYTALDANLALNLLEEHTSTAQSSS